jgi:hypothetical protein
MAIKEIKEWFKNIIDTPGPTPPRMPEPRITVALPSKTAEDRYVAYLKYQESEPEREPTRSKNKGRGREM